MHRLSRIRIVRSDERGFTMLEILLVILVIGILAAIALPTLLGNESKGKDGQAKSDARNVVSHVEACYAESNDYAQCMTVAQIGANGLPLVDGAPANGQVAVTAGVGGTFTVTSKSQTGNVFEIERAPGGVIEHDCTTQGKAGCPTGGNW